MPLRRSPERIMRESQAHWSSRLPFYYGWLIVGVAFVTVAIGVTARTALKAAVANRRT
jgi:hypothetical protein